VLPCETASRDLGLAITEETPISESALQRAGNDHNGMWDHDRTNSAQRRMPVGACKGPSGRLVEVTVQTDLHKREHNLLCATLQRGEA